MASSFVSCRNINDEAVIKCGNVELIDRFSMEISLEPVAPHVSGLLGIVHIHGLDSVFMGVHMEGDYHTSLYSFRTGEKLMNLFKKGQGPDEYYYEPSVQRVYCENDSLMVDFYNHYGPNAGLMTMNVPATMETGYPVVSKRVSSGRYRGCKYIIPVESGDTLFVEYKRPEGGFDRSVIGADGVVHNVLPYDCGTDLSVLDGNIVSFLPLVAKAGDRVYEAMINLNQVSVYSLSDSTYRKTVCVGDALDNLERIDGLSRGTRKRAYGGVQAIGDKVVFLYQGISEQNYQDDKGNSELQVFDMEMNPVLRISLPVVAESFHVDRSGQLYLFNCLGKDEYIYRYDTSDIFK